MAGTQINSMIYNLEEIEELREKLKGTINADEINDDEINSLENNCLFDFIGVRKCCNNESGRD